MNVSPNDTGAVTRSIPLGSLLAVLISDCAASASCTMG
jgi:hypothetical protein